MCAAVLLFDAQTGKQLERTVQHSQEIVEVSFQQVRAVRSLPCSHLSVHCSWYTPVELAYSPTYTHPHQHASTNIHPRTSILIHLYVHVCEHVQAGAGSDRMLFVIDRNRDLFVASLGSVQLVKLGAMADRYVCLCYDVASDVL